MKYWRRKESLLKKNEKDFYEMTTGGKKWAIEMLNNNNYAIRIF